MSTGVVRVWHAENGWGVIDSPDTPDGCRADGAVVEGEDALRAGQPVTFDWERGQDGSAVATHVAPTRDTTLGA